MPIERLYINEAKQHLALKSIGAVEKWCETNDVRVYIERGRKFMCRIEFLTALERPFIKSLKAKYGENWRKIYQVMETNDPAELSDFKDDNYPSPPNPLNRMIRYRPKSDMAKSFVKKMNQSD